MKTMNPGDIVEIRQADPGFRNDAYLGERTGNTLLSLEEETEDQRPDSKGMVDRLRKAATVLTTTRPSGLPATNLPRAGPRSSSPMRGFAARK